jgi:molybdopterin-synthase adenylyltransferase
MITGRYDRNIRMFGEAGQERLRATRVALVGVGGLGSAVAQHLALLGVGRITLIEPEELDESNRNRFIGAKVSDGDVGCLKTDIVRRSIKETNPDVEVAALPSTFIAEEGFAAIKTTDWVFGCLDHDGARFILNELCVAYEKSYIDLASDVLSSKEYGGRVCVLQPGNGCLCCADVLDMQEVSSFLRSPVDRNVREAIYGVPIDELRATGPSVAPLNGVIAALAAVEFMVAVTGLRSPRQHLQYYGHLGTVRSRSDALNADCPSCSLKGQRDLADVERYLRIPHLRRT